MVIQGQLHSVPLLLLNKRLLTGKNSKLGAKKLKNYDSAFELLSIHGLWFLQKYADFLRF